MLSDQSPRCPAAEALASMKSADAWADLHRLISVFAGHTYGPRHAKTCHRAYVGSEGTACASTQSVQGSCYCKESHWILQNVSMESKCLNETTHVQDDVSLYIFLILECMFLLDAAHIIMYVISYVSRHEKTCLRGKCKQ